MKYSFNTQIIKYFSSRNIFVHCNIFDNKIFLIKFDKQIFHLIIFLKRKYSSWWNIFDNEWCNILTWMCPALELGPTTPPPPIIWPGSPSSSPSLRNLLAAPCSWQRRSQFQIHNMLPLSHSSRSSKPPNRAISCLSLHLYGMRIGYLITRVVGGAGSQATVCLAVERPRGSWGCRVILKHCTAWSNLISGGQAQK